MRATFDWTTLTVNQAQGAIDPAPGFEVGGGVDEPAERPPRSTAVLPCAGRPPRQPSHATSGWRFQAPNPTKKLRVHSRRHWTSGGDWESEGSALLRQLSAECTAHLDVFVVVRQHSTKRHLDDQLAGPRSPPHPVSGPGPHPCAARGPRPGRTPRASHHRPRVSTPGNVGRPRSTRAPPARLRCLGAVTSSATFRSTNS